MITYHYPEDWATSHLVKFNVPVTNYTWPTIGDAEIKKIASAVAARLNTASNQCVMCDKEGYGSPMPYGSKYDGEFVCDECLIMCMDRAIAFVQEMKRVQGTPESKG